MKSLIFAIICPFVIKQSRNPAQACLLILFHRLKRREKKTIMTNIAGFDHCLLFSSSCECPVPIRHHNGRGTSGHHKWCDNCRDDPLPRQWWQKNAGHLRPRAHVSEVLRGRERRVKQTERAWEFSKPDPLFPPPPALNCEVLPWCHRFWCLVFASG